MNSPDVSVLLTTYNGLPFLRESIASILGQSLRDIELVVVDDGSTDGTETFLESIDDPRLVVISQANSGTAAAANAGLAVCRGQLIARMDADDISVPERLEAQVAYLADHPQVGILGSWTQNLGLHGQLGAVNRLPTAHDAIAEALWAGRHALSHPSLLIRAEVLDQIGGYWSYRLVDDWDMMMRAIEVTRAANLDQPLLQYRVHPGSLNGRSALRVLAHKEFSIVRAAARRDGRIEPSYEEFLADRLTRPLVEEISQRAQARSLDFYRRGVRRQLDGASARGLADVAMAGLLDPGAALRRLRR